MNRGCSYSSLLPKRARGLGIIDWLTAEHDHSTRDEWTQRVAAGLVTLDEHPATVTSTLDAGQRLTWSRPPWAEPEVPLEFGIVHEDADLLVVDKPSGLPTLPGGEFYEHTLLAVVQQKDPAWAAMHRLGRGTSGLVVFARPAAQAAVAAAFRDRKVLKRYRATISGPLEPQTITAPIGLVPHARMGELYAVTETGRFAQTIVERVEGDLADVRIITGRPHQIRIHLAHVGAPLTGDPLYGPRGELKDARPSDLGYTLRAWQLTLGEQTFTVPH